jgi:RNA-directed DNA polymerase
MVTANPLATATAALDVNGPEDVDLDWDAVDWRFHEEQVRRLRQRIFKATQGGDLKRVRNLQKLMLRSRSNTLVSVRQVAQRNAGRATAGIDGQVALTSRHRAELAEHLHRHAPPWQAVRSSGSTYRRPTENGARSEFRSFQIARSKHA